MDRIEKALEGITKEMRGLEIGPSYNPVAPKRDGWNINVIDHADQKTLRDKYRGHPVDRNAIEEVDFVCGDNDFLKAVPQELHGTFDYIISSHMIEHTTDLIRFVNQMETLLAPEGILSLIVPDKLYCFDFFRPITTTADVLYAYHQKRQAHSIRTAFEHIAYITYYDDRIIWGERAPDPARFKLYHSLDQAVEAFGRLSDAPDSEYKDFHNWKFTPASFRLVMLELHLMKKIRLATRRFHPSLNGEFFLQLGRAPMALPDIASEEAQAMRLALLLEIQQEMVTALTPPLSVVGDEPVPGPDVARTSAARAPLWVRAAKRAIPAPLHPACKEMYRKLRSAA